MKKEILAVSLGLALTLMPSFHSKVYSEDFPGSSVLSDGYDAYRKGDYMAAVFFLKKALMDSSNSTDGAWYMLIMAQLNTGDYQQASSDCQYFLNAFPESPLCPVVKYQHGRSLYFCEEYDKAVLVLSDFCHENPENEMFPSALFWMGEAFYAGYNYDEARPLYQRIREEYSSDSKAILAGYRLESIAQKAREDKLLYLLRQTGEDYLSSKENYEKIMRQYQMENAVDLNQQVRNLRSQNSRLESALETEKLRVRELQERLEGYVSESQAREQALSNERRERLQQLKKSAGEAQELLGDGE